MKCQKLIRIKDRFICDSTRKKNNDFFYKIVLRLWKIGRVKVKNLYFERNLRHFFYINIPIDI